MVIKSSRRRHCNNNIHNYNMHPQPHSSALAGALRDLEQVFSQADARKEERFRRGGILPSDALTLIPHGPLRVLLSATPTPSTLPSYIDALRNHGVSHVVRLCEPHHYDANALTAHGFTHHDWPFADGEVPPFGVVRNWLALLDELFQLRKHAARFPSSGFFHPVTTPATPNDSDTLSLSSASMSTSTSPNSSADGISPKHQYVSSSSSSSPSSPQQRNTTPLPPTPAKPTTVAIHCAAGLGRAPVLVAVALVELGLSPHEAVGWMRAERRGAINAKQLAYLQQYQRRSALPSHHHHHAHHFDHCQQQVYHHHEHQQPQTQYRSGRARRDGCSRPAKKGRSASNNSGGQNNSRGRCRNGSGTPGNGGETIDGGGGGGCTSSSASADNKASRSPFSFLSSWRRSLSPSGKAKQQQQQQQQVLESPRVSDCGSCTGSVNGGSGSGKHARKLSGGFGGIWSAGSGVSSRCASPNTSGATTTSTTSTSSFGAHRQQYTGPRCATTGSAAYAQPQAHGHSCASSSSSSAAAAAAGAQQQQQQTTVQYNFYQPSQVFVVQQEHHHHHHHHHHANVPFYQYQYFQGAQKQKAGGHWSCPTRCGQPQQEQAQQGVGEMMMKAGFYDYHNESGSQSPSRQYQVHQQEEEEQVEDSPSSSYQTLKAMRKAQLAQGRYVSM